MSAYPAWTPAPRPGIVPLHPLSFGTILGRSFAALRQNPRVLLGFALVVQVVASLVVVAAVAAVGFASLSRLDTLRPGTDDYDAVLAGSVALVVITGLALGLAAAALGVLVQGVVVAEVAHAAVAEKLTLRQLWGQVRPVAGRLVGYGVLVTVAVVVALAIVTAVIVAVAFVVLPVAIALIVLALLAAIPLYLWLAVKLLLAPAAMILEGEGMLTAIGRSWRLTRGRFWAALGVIVIITVSFAAIAQAVSIPFSILTSAVSAVVAPTGTTASGALIVTAAGLVLTQVVTVVVQAVSLVVQSTATALIYLDCRMRREGLDLDLIAYVDQRDAGAIAPADPYRVHAGREIAPRPAPGAYAPGAPYPGAYPQATAVPPAPTWTPPSRAPGTDPS